MCASWCEIYSGCFTGTNRWELYENEECEENSHLSTSGCFSALLDFCCRWTLCLGSFCINYKNCLCRCVRTLASLSALCALFMEYDLNEEGALKERRRTLKRTENKKIMLQKKLFCKLWVFLLSLLLLNIPSLISDSTEDICIIVHFKQWSLSS